MCAEGGSPSSKECRQALWSVAKLYRERDEYVLTYLPDTDPFDFVSLTMPVRAEPWRWPRDLHPFFRQNLPEGYLLSIIREEFRPLLDGTDFHCWR
jgi:serine/threonine-protein kinase HipA